MTFDLKRTYFGITAFVVLMMAFVSGLSFLSAGSTMVILSTVPFEQRYPPGYPPQAVMPPAPAAPSGTSAATPAPQLEPPYPAKEGPMEDWELRNAKEQVATSLAAMILAFPIWYFHWRRYRQLAYEKKAFLLYRIYGYAFMVIALITMIVAGGMVLSQGIRAILGVLDLSTKYAQLNLAHQIVGSLLGVGWAFLFWYYHWRIVESVPEEG